MKPSGLRPTNLLRLLLCCALAGGWTIVGRLHAQDDPKPVVKPKGEFLYENAPFPSCHASTIEETDRGLVAAWFGGTEEKHPDVGIWVSRRENDVWTAPVEVANGIVSPTERYPTWNPVLFQPRPRKGAASPLILFYKIGPSPETWWGMMMTSSDGGITWSKPARLPDGILGPIKNKPIEMEDGTWLCPSSTETEEEPSKWQIHFEWTKDGDELPQFAKPNGQQLSIQLRAGYDGIYTLRYKDSYGLHEKRFRVISNRKIKFEKNFFLIKFFYLILINKFFLT
jgi:hypothetical protein